jgi:excinuclease ABC subunit C
MAKQHIEALLKKLPSTPGVYKLKDEEGKILYVGKAKSLNNRVRSYFRKQKGRAKRTEKLVEATADIEWIEVGSDLEAIFLETNLIKEYRPKYNVLMKDDKNFVYIKITKNEDYPRIKIVRRVERDGARYFGPKTAAGKVKKMLVLMQKLFLYRSCDLGIDWRGDIEGAENRKTRDLVNITKKSIAFPCLDYHIKRCAAPCIGEITPEEYAVSIRRIELFLEGKTENVVKEIEEQMKQLVADKAFEKAAILRDKYLALKDLLEKQIITAPSHENLDIFAFALDNGKAYFNLFQVRDGKLINQENFIADAPGFESGEEKVAHDVLESFLYQYYRKASDVPGHILVPINIEEEDFFEDWLSNQLGRSVKLHCPQRGKKADLVALAEKNALSFLKQHRARWSGFDQNDEQSLEELKQFLGLKKLPKRIECYDISHLGGTDTVASMVVFENGRAKKSDYRKYKIKTLASGEIDDFASMREVLKRRLRRLNAPLKGYKFRKGSKTSAKHIAALRLEWHGDEEVRGPVEEHVLAYLDKSPVGMIRMTPGRNDSHLLRSLFVSQQFREMGMARALFVQALKKSKSKRVYLTCFKETKSFYEGLGFERVKTMPKTFSDLYLDEVKEKHPGEEILFYAYDPSKHYDASLKSKPDLIVIDGGKGQLSSAIASRDKYELSIPIIGLAKKHEDVYLEGKSLPLLIPKDGEACKLLQRLRNEAHRFAITFQRKSRKKYLRESKLDHVKGLGDVGKMKLLEHFGSLAQVEKANLEEIEKLVGEKLAHKIKDHLDGE